MFNHKFFKLLCIINLFNLGEGFYDICIIGASSGLGKELVYQSLNKELRVLALTNSLDPIREPYRGGGLNDNLNMPIISNRNLKVKNYWNDINSNYDYNNIVFTLGSSPFKEDYSYYLTKEYLNNLSLECKSLNLVSAYGVGNSLENANAGIKIMENFYLKKVYEAKNKQEELIKNFKRSNEKITNPYYKKKINIQNKILKKNIYRPKLLSYGENLFNGQSRENLASKILSNINL